MDGQRALCSKHLCGPYSRRDPCPLGLQEISTVADSATGLQEGWVNLRAMTPKTR